MDKQSFIFMLIEAVAFLIPVVGILVKFGKVIERIDNMEENMKDLPEWKAKTDEKVVRLEIESNTMNANLKSINDILIDISTKVGLLINDKIKM